MDRCELHASCKQIVHDKGPAHVKCSWRACIDDVVAGAQMLLQLLLSKSAKQAQSSQQLLRVATIACEQPV